MRISLKLGGVFIAIWLHKTILLHLYNGELSLRGRQCSILLLNFYMCIGAVSVKVKSTCCGTSYGPYISAMFVYIRNLHANRVNVVYEFRSCCSDNNKIFKLSVVMRAEQRKCFLGTAYRVLN